MKYLAILMLLVAFLFVGCGVSEKTHSATVDSLTVATASVDSLTRAVTVRDSVIASQAALITKLSTPVVAAKSVKAKKTK